MPKILQSIVITSFILALLSCNYSDNVSETTKELPIDTLETIIGNNWNFVINERDTNLLEYNNQPLYFRNNTAYFSYSELGKLNIKGDTISINFFPNRNLIGLINKLTIDTLKIKWIEGWGLSSTISNVYFYYNDKLIYKPDLKLDKVVYATSLCYGRCPEMTIEIESNSIYKFHGGEFSEFKGNYMGTIDQDFFKKLEYELRFANIEGQPTYFSEPSDAPTCELIFYFNNGLRKKIVGFSGGLPVRLKNIGSMLYNSYKYANFEKVEGEIQFEIQAQNLIPSPPPPKDMEID